jgi:hypothetical protein
MMGLGLSGFGFLPTDFAPPICLTGQTDMVMRSYKNVYSIQQCVKPGYKVS